MAEQLGLNQQQLISISILIQIFCLKLYLVYSPIKYSWMNTQIANEVQCYLTQLNQITENRLPTMGTDNGLLYLLC